MERVSKCWHPQLRAFTALLSAASIQPAGVGGVCLLGGGCQRYGQAMSVVELDPELVPIADSLMTRSTGIYGPDFVRDLVAHIAAEFDDVPVRDYVEVLIAKEAMDELRRLNVLRTLNS